MDYGEMLLATEELFYAMPQMNNGQNWKQGSVALKNPGLNDIFMDQKWNLPAGGARGARMSS